MYVNCDIYGTLKICSRNRVVFVDNSMGLGVQWAWVWKSSDPIGQTVFQTRGDTTNSACLTKKRWTACGICN